VISRPPSTGVKTAHDRPCGRHDFIKIAQARSACGQTSSDMIDLQQPAPRMRVLLCDDEPHVLRGVKVVLRQAGFDTVLAGTHRMLGGVQDPRATACDAITVATHASTIIGMRAQWGTST
jgi:hypothetical protein